MQAMGRLLVTLVTPVFVVVGLHCGIGMPDIDQRTNLLLHRSIITHSPLIPFILLILASRIGWDYTRLRWASASVLPSTTPSIYFRQGGRLRAH